MTFEMGEKATVSKSQLLFEKRTVAELSDNELMSIDGGSTPVCLQTFIYNITNVIYAPSSNGGNNADAIVIGGALGGASNVIVK